MTDVYSETEETIRTACVRMAPDIDPSKIKILLPRATDKFDMSTNAAFMLAEALQSTKK